MSRLLIGFLSFALFAFSQETTQQAAEKSASNWLALVDSGDYKASWQDAAEPFKKAVPEDKWEAAVSQVRGQTGKLKTRTLKSAILTESLPDAPPGKYVVIQYDSSFQSGTFIETVTPMLEKNGTWKVSGYYVKPAQ